MTIAVNAEPAIVSAETTYIKEKNVKRKNVVYEAVVDPDLIKIACEKLKKQLFAKFAFYWFQPKLEEIQFVSLDKYYKPYIVISGNYFIDYLRKSTYTVNVPEGVKEVVLISDRYIPEISKSKKIVKLKGKERLIHNVKASLFLDENGQDSKDENVPCVLPAKNPEKVIEECGIEELDENADVNFIRERIARRPKDVCEIMEEIFEVTERAVIYLPRYKLLFRWVKTGEERSLILDAITAEKAK